MPDEQQGTPTPDLMAAIDALDSAPEFSDSAPQSQPAATADQPGRDAAPAANDQQPEQQPGESAVDYKARVAELETQIANREWSSQGRYLKEKARADALEAEAKRLREGYSAEDEYRVSLYNQAIARTNDPREQQLLERERDAEIAERKRTRDQATESATRQVSEAERTAEQQVSAQYHEKVIRTEAIPEMTRFIDQVREHYELPDEEVEAIRATINTPANRLLLQNAPIALIKDWAGETLSNIVELGKAAQARTVARNRDDASSRGIYRSAVDAASAGRGRPSLAQYAGTNDLEGAYDALYGEE